MKELERLASEFYATNAVAPMPPVTLESIREAMRSLPPKEAFEPIRVTTRQLVALKRHFANQPRVEPPDFMRFPNLGFGFPVEVDDDNPTVPES